MSRFSLLYAQRGAPIPDSERFRRRLAGYYTQFHRDYNAAVEIRRMLERDSGAHVPLINNATYALEQFILTGPRRDILDLITHAFIAFQANYKGGFTSSSFPSPWEWLRFVRGVLDQENMAYAVDDNCVVHPRIDDEFQQSRAASVAALAEPRFAAALYEFEKSFDRLDAPEPDTTAAIREMHAAAESLTKTLTNESSDLDVRFVAKFIIPRMKQKYAGEDTRVLSSAEQLCNALSKWVDSGHSFRHGHNSEKPIKPPLDFAVLYLSQGAAWMRWLVDVFDVNE